MVDEALHIPGVRAEPSCSTHALRRLHCGELTGEAETQLRTHLSGCARCTATWSSLEEEQRQFASEVPYPRFADRVQQRSRPTLLSRAMRWQPALAAAAVLVVMVWAGPKLLEKESRGNRIKGTSVIELWVGGAGATPRVAVEGETLAPGERVRVGYRALDHRYVAVISIDSQGEVTPLYPESGPSFRSADGAGPHLLPDSVIFSGAGYEKVIAVFSDEPLEVERLAEAAKREFERAGAVERMKPLGLGQEEDAQLVRKD